MNRLIECLLFQVEMHVSASREANKGIDELSFSLIIQHDRSSMTSTRDKEIKMSHKMNTLSLCLEIMKIKYQQKFFHINSVAIGRNIIQ